MEVAVIRRLGGWAGLLVVAALFLGACSKSGSSPPFSTQVVGPEGGTFELPNGFGLIVPPGALDEATPLSLRQLTDPEKDALANNDRILPKRFLGGFFAEPEGVEFLVPIQVVVPLEQDLQPGGLPLMVTADHRNRSYVAPTCLDHDPAARRATLELTHFSYWAEVEAELARAAAECSDPATACRCGAIHVETEASDFSSGECQSVSDTVRVTFLDCPGQPTEESTQTDETAGCDEEDDTGGGGGGGDPCEGELWAIAQEYIEAWNRLVHFGSTWEMVASVELVMPGVTRYGPPGYKQDDPTATEVWVNLGAERVSSVTTLRFSVPDLDPGKLCEEMRSAFAGASYEELVGMLGEDDLREWIGGMAWQSLAIGIDEQDLEAQVETKLSVESGERTIRYGRLHIASIYGSTRKECWTQYPCGPTHWDACPLSHDNAAGSASVGVSVEFDELRFPRVASLFIKDLSDVFGALTPPTRDSTGYMIGFKLEDPCDPGQACCPILTEPTCLLHEVSGSSYLLAFLLSDWSQVPPTVDWETRAHKEASTLEFTEIDDDPLYARILRTRRSLRLRCVERCECGSPEDAICDDLNPCTVDSCALPAGVCRHEPVADGPLDDESPSDCLDRYCIGGEPTGMADDSEVPEQDEPGDCHRMACVDGEPTGLSDDADAPPDLPGDCTRVLCHDGEAAGLPADDDLPAQISSTDCWRQVCDDGFVADVPDDAEVPPQDSPTDCLRQVCLDGTVTTVPAPEEPGC